MPVSTERLAEISKFAFSLTDEEAVHMAKYLRERPPTDPMLPTAVEIEYMRNFNRIQAIKELRMRTGLGLREAKEITDMWMRNPDKYRLR